MPGRLFSFKNTAVHLCHGKTFKNFKKIFISEVSGLMNSHIFREIPRLRPFTLSLQRSTLGMTGALGVTRRRRHIPVYRSERSDSHVVKS
jgi:hypothetical protein